MKLNKLKLIVAVTTFPLVIIIIPTVAAAQARNRRPTPRTPDSVREMRERDMNIRRLEIEKENGVKTTTEVSKETVKQVNEDFARIQDINAEVMRDYVSGAVPNYKHISEAMAEINKRATRLNTSLLLPPSDAAANDQVTPVGLKRGEARSPLLDLSDLIHGFVTNPIFKNVNTIDLALGTKAKRDLEGIIDLSDKISKSAGKLSKATAQSH